MVRILAKQGLGRAVDACESARSDARRFHGDLRDGMSGEIWAISDAAAGNARQAQALAEALAASLPGTGPPRSLRLRSAAPWRWASPLRLPGAATAFGPEFAATLAAPPRIAIGCGRQAALATRLLRAAGAKAVQILDPRLDARLWDAVVAPHHDALRGGNVIEVLGSLHPVDAGWLARARDAFARLGALPVPRTGLLLGGPARGAPWTRGGFEVAAARLEAWLARDGGSLMISGSRRTPRWLRELVRARYADVPGLRWFGAEDGENPYPGLLAWADRLIVSADSINLLSEACASAVPVSVAMADAARGRHAEFLRALRACDRARTLDAVSAPWPVTPLIELPRVVAELRERLQL